MNVIAEKLIEKGVGSEIITNGYRYRFEHNGMRFDFNAYHGYGDNGRITGRMYEKELNESEIEQMQKDFLDVKDKNFGNLEFWIESFVKYGCKTFSIRGNVDEIVQELFRIHEMSNKDYIGYRFDGNKIYQKLLKDFSV